MSTLEKLCNASSIPGFLWENSRECLVLFSPSGTVICANPAFCYFLEYAEEELIGRLITDLTFVNDNYIDQLKFRQLIEGKIKEYTIYKKWIAKSGKLVGGEFHARKWSDGILIFGTILPVNEVVKAALKDEDAQKILNEAIGKWARSLPIIILKNLKLWILAFAFISGSLGINELLNILVGK